MAEILIRVRDNLGDKPPKTVEVNRMHRGDVVCWNPIGWAWSNRELENPAWRIVRISLTISELEALVSTEIGVGEIKMNQWKRLRKLNIDALPSGKLEDFFADDARLIPILDYKGPLSVFRSIMVTKPDADMVVL